MSKQDWDSYRELFLHELKENGKQFRQVSDALEMLRLDVAAVKVDVSGLKVKAALAGGIAGVLGTAAASFVLTAMK